MKSNEFDLTIDNFNQNTYTDNPGLNAQFDEENSTIYLVYRDILKILENHLLQDIRKNHKIRILDYGCGDGLSAKIILDKLNSQGYQCEIHGVDINNVQIEAAKKLVPEGNFHQVTLGQSLDDYSNFDLAICNFVLLENTQIEMEKIPKIIYSTLNENGIAIFINNTSNVYHPDNAFYNVHSPLTIDKLTRTSRSGKKMPCDGEEVPVEVTEKDGSKIEYRDYFYSGKTYVKTFFNAGFSVPETWKPIAKDDPNCPWRNEGIFSDEKPMYRIDVCKKNQFLQLQGNVEKIETNFGKSTLRK